MYQTPVFASAIAVAAGAQPSSTAERLHNLSTLLSKVGCRLASLELLPACCRGARLANAAAAVASSSSTVQLNSTLLVIPIINSCVGKFSCFAHSKCSTRSTGLNHQMRGFVSYQKYGIYDSTIRSWFVVM
jgi:hypothetical protein